MEFARKSASHRLLLFGARAAVCLVILLLVGVASSSFNLQQRSTKELKRVRRSIPADANNDTSGDTTCISPSIDEFPPDLFTSNQRSSGGVIIHVIITLYLLAVLSIVCDDYFVTALNKICDKLNLSSDVAGATFLAAGGSAPEMFASVIGVFVAQSDVGVGTIVGSAVFNVLFVVGICALTARTVIQLNWYPLTRDCIYYLLSVLAITLIILDGRVEWYEGLILLIMYAIYIGIMYFNPRIENLANRRMLPRRMTISEELQSFSNLEEQQQHEHEQHPETKTSEETETNGTPSDEGTSAATKESDDPNDENESIFDMPKSIPKRIFWAIMLPANLLLLITIPDCRRHCFRNFYVLTFAMSLLWIAASSYLVVWMVCIIGYTTGIPDSVMGLTFLAAGASLPEIMSCIIVARAGEGDMAISGSIGSNVFDLLLCLGLPWFISSAIVHPGVPVHIDSSGLTYSSALLFSTVIILLLGTKLNGWRLTKTYGIVLLVIWLIVTMLMCLFELNVIGNFRPPTCAYD